LKFIFKFIFDGVYITNTFITLISSAVENGYKVFWVPSHTPLLALQSSWHGRLLIGLPTVFQ